MTNDNQAETTPRAYTLEQFEEAHGELNQLTEDLSEERGTIYRILINPELHGYLTAWNIRHGYNAHKVYINGYEVYSHPTCKLFDTLVLRYMPLVLSSTTGDQVKNATPRMDEFFRTHRMKFHNRSAHKKALKKYDALVAAQQGAE